MMEIKGKKERETIGGWESKGRREIRKEELQKKEKNGRMGKEGEEKDTKRGVQSQTTFPGQKDDFVESYVGDFLNWLYVY